MTFPGGCLIVDNAGLLNASRIKGSHCAIKSGMLAAEAAFDALASGRSADELIAYPQAFRKSWLFEELHRARNFKPWMSKGLFSGTLMVGIDQIVFGGKAPWTLNHAHADHETLRRKTEVQPIQYPKPDWVLTFDRLSSVFISNTNHSEDHGASALGRPFGVNLTSMTRPSSATAPWRLRDRERNVRPAAADQRAECALQDLRHQGPDAEHQLGAPEGGGPNYPNM
jgi:electron-transferring-flavoprotein dehydrogenase